MWEKYLTEEALKNPNRIVQTDGNPSPVMPSVGGDLYPKLSSRTTVPHTVPSGQPGVPPYGRMDGFKFSSVGNGVSKGMEAESRAMKVVNEDQRGYTTMKESGVDVRRPRNAMNDQKKYQTSKYKNSSSGLVQETTTLGYGSTIMITALHSLFESGQFI